MLGVGENTRLLQRYEVIERACLRVTAGWAMATTAWDVKVTLGRHMWQEAQRADRLRVRLKELRSGPLAQDNQTGLAEVVDYAARATNSAEYIVGMYGVVKEALLRAYHLHREMTDMALDDGTLEALSANITSLEEQCRWAKGIAGLDPWPDHDSATSDPWVAVITARLRESGGVDGGQLESEQSATTMPPRPPFQRPHEQRLDGFTLRRDRDPPPEEMGEAWQEYVFRTFMNEIGAADNVASLVFDAPPHLDWDCLYAIARHGWDEYRHASMGWQRLRDLGLEPTSFPLGTGTFEFRDRLSLVDRLGMLVFVDESSAFGYKHSSRKFFHSIGDTVSESYLLYDICDETRHVANGRRWIAHWQQATGDTRTHDQLVADVRALLHKRIAYIGTGNSN